MSLKKFSIQTFSLFIFLSIAVGTSAQTIYFCESVDQSGAPVNQSNAFIIGNNGGYFDFLVKLPYEARSYYVNYDIYKLSSDGSEQFDNTIRQEIEPDYNWFWKEVTFYDEGTYKVYVYDDNDYLITSSSVKVRKN
ncbi:MAG TPA: hypothetical protein DCQ93_08575 [Bacteroidetes bacterium]|nr:hypothetical protein [Bacteroidota bacterium]